LLLLLAAAPVLLLLLLKQMPLPAVFSPDISSRRLLPTPLPPPALASIIRLSVPPRVKSFGDSTAAIASCWWCCCCCCSSSSFVGCCCCCCSSLRRFSFSRSRSFSSRMRPSSRSRMSSPSATPLPAGAFRSFLLSRLLLLLLLVSLALPSLSAAPPPLPIENTLAALFPLTGPLPLRGPPGRLALAGPLASTPLPVVRPPLPPLSLLSGCSRSSTDADLPPLPLPPPLTVR
jgi:hypothetical protein